MPWMLTPPRGGRDVSRQQRAHPVPYPPGVKHQVCTETVAILTPVTRLYMDALRTQRGEDSSLNTAPAQQIGGWA